MTAPPLPASPCMRVRLVYTQSDGFEGGSRFYLSYAGAAPSGANCVSLATAIAGFWASEFESLIGNTWALTEVDVLDIATDAGLSGVWSGSNAGTQEPPMPPASTAYNVEFDISRRYRGGKPRMFLPPGPIARMSDASHWAVATIDAVNTAFAAFIASIEAESIGAVGQLTHVNLSYYKGFTNIVNSSGRSRAVPTYRDAALLDTIVGYATKGVIGSQRRRRIATTP